jgi:hypothetical protein
MFYTYFLPGYSSYPQPKPESEENSLRRKEYNSEEGRISEKSIVMILMRLFLTNMTRLMMVSHDDWWGWTRVMYLRSHHFMLAGGYVGLGLGDIQPLMQVCTLCILYVNGRGFESIAGRWDGKAMLSTIHRSYATSLNPDYSGNQTHVDIQDIVRSDEHRAPRFVVRRIPGSEDHKER